MHRHDRARSRGDRGLRRVRVQSEALRLHVHEYGTRSERGHGARAGEIGEGIQLDAKVPEQEGAGVRADGLHLGRVDDPAGNHVDLAGLERYGV